jgi:small subunit ribosomal protein S5
MSFDKKGQHKESSDLQDKVLFVNRCAKVVKGGRTFSFSALVSVGDGKGRLGIGFGKASDVSDAIRKGTESAMKNVRQYPIGEITIEHEVHGAADGTEVLIKPTGRNPANIVRATIAALEQLESAAKAGV